MSNPNTPWSIGDGPPAPEHGGGKPDDPWTYSNHRNDEATPNAWEPHSSPMPSGDNPPLTGPNDPAVRGLVAGGKGATRVNTLMLKQFAQNLRTLAEPLRNTQQELSEVAVHPGTFPTAMAMRKGLNAPEGDNALAKTLSASMVNLYNGLMELSDALLKIANKYDTAEELNKLDLQSYKEQLAVASGYLQKMNTGGAG